MAVAIKELACAGTMLASGARVKTNTSEALITRKKCFNVPEISRECTKKSIKFAGLKLINKEGFICLSELLMLTKKYGDYPEIL